jgi:hypothetical protein
MAQPVLKKVRARCKICQLELMVDIPVAEIQQAEEFPVAFRFIHGAPPHCLSLFFDAALRVRSVESNKLVSVSPEALRFWTGDLTADACAETVQGPPPMPLVDAAIVVDLENFEVLALVRNPASILVFDRVLALVEELRDMDHLFELDEFTVRLGPKVLHCTRDHLYGINYVIVAAACTAEVLLVGLTAELQKVFQERLDEAMADGDRINYNYIFHRAGLKALQRWNEEANQRLLPRAEILYQALFPYSEITAGEGEQYLLDNLVLRTICDAGIITRTQLLQETQKMDSGVTDTDLDIICTQFSDVGFIAGVRTQEGR